MAIINKPNNFFNTALWTGNNNARTVSGVGFQTDLLWEKCRSNTYSHILIDSVRGITKQLSSNSDTLEATNAQGVTAFNSDGYVLGTQDEFANNGNTFVGWSWKAGTSVSGTTTGSGTGKAYSGSVNTDSGFSIIKYVGNGTAGHTIPHNLGAAPKMVICKSMSENRGWPIQHSGLTSAAYAIFLSSTGAQANNPAGGGTNTWNSTAASSSVVTLGNNANNNSNDQTYIMYSFAEKQGYSSIGSYVGNGNANGPFIYTGFKPAFVMIKNTETTSTNWVMIDNKRPGYNSNNYQLFPNLNAIETTNYGLDIFSNGFKPLTNLSWINENEDKMIYMAFAENPFVTSTGNGSTPTTAR